MQAGQLKQQVFFYALARVETDTGTVRVKQLICAPFTHVFKSSGGEKIDKTRESETADFLFTIRWRENFAPSTAVYKGAEYQVTSIDNEDEKDVFLIVRASK